MGSELAKKIFCRLGDEKEKIIAMNAIKESGNIYTGLLDRADGVITDLFFDPIGYNPKALFSIDYRENPPPAGLIVAIHCLGLGVPVIIRSDMDLNLSELGVKDPTFHHGPNYAWLWDYYFSDFMNYFISGWKHEESTVPPTMIVGGNDWQRAIKYLLILIDVKTRKFKEAKP